ncbi:MAG: hypothetical protein ACYC91_07510 [Solirubrobacteraceae bacterium]
MSAGAPRPRPALEALLAALAGLLAAALALRLWHASLNVPFEYAGNDSEYQLMLVKGVLETGSWFTNPHLAAPFGQELYDFAVGGDTMHLLLIRGLGLFSSRPAVVANLFYLLSFPMSGASAFAVLRWSGASRPAAGVSAILFAISPFALLRGEHHAFFAADYGVPLGAGLALAAIERRALFAGRSSRRTLLTLGACLVVGATGTFYYGTFTIVLLVAAGAIVAWRDGPRAALAPALCVAAILFVFALELAPTLVYDAAHGSDPAATIRGASESDLYGLKLTQLVLPVPGERIGALARLSDRYSASSFPPASNESSSSVLGLVAALGFLSLLAAALLACARGATGTTRASPLLDCLSAPAALGVIAFLLGTIGGLGTLFAYLITPDLRGWNRVSPVIAFLSLLAVARLLDLAGGRRRARSRLAWTLAAVLLGVGAFDQTPSRLVPPYGVSAIRWLADAAFSRRVDAMMPAGAEVFELPYEPFPEGSPLNSMGGYDPLRGYLHDSRLRWSFGAIRGRPGDWAAQLAQQPPQVKLPAIAAAGFTGLWIDADGLPGGQRDVTASLSALLGTSAIRGGAGDSLVFFDLRPYAARLRLASPPGVFAAAAAATLHPLTVGDPASSSALREPIGQAGQVGQVGQVRTLIAHNPSAQATRATLTLLMLARPGSLLSLRGGGVAATLSGQAAGRFVALYRVTVTLAPGRSRFALSMPRASGVLFSAVLTDRSQLELARAAANL